MSAPKPNSFAPSEQAIHTHFVYPPIPTRNFDWMACRGDYEPGVRVGYGATEQAAIDDLLEQEDSEQVDNAKPPMASSPAPDSAVSNRQP